MASSSMPRLTRTEPWDLMNAFTEQLMRQAAAEQVDARKVEMAPLELELLKERKKFEEGLKLDNLPRELSIRTEDADKRAVSELGRNKDLVSHRTNESLRYGSDLHRKNLETDIDLYGKNPKFFSQKFKSHTKNDIEEPNTTVVPNNQMDREALKEELTNRGITDIEEFSKGGKSYFRWKDPTKTQTPTANKPVTESVNPDPNVQSSSRSASPKGDRGASPTTAPSPQQPSKGSWVDPPALDLAYPPRKVPGPGEAMHRERVSDARPSLDIDDSKKELMQGMYNSYRRAGFSHNGAKALIAEVGRENSFDPKLIFGTHSDPHNKVTNVGAMSWQGSRGEAVKKELAARGLLRGGQIVPSQEALDVMAQFTADELGGTSSRLLSYLQNEDVDYPTAAQALGRRYVKWRYDDPRYASSHENRDQWYDRATMMFDMEKGKDKKRPQVQATADPDIFDVILDGVG